MKQLPDEVVNETNELLEELRREKCRPALDPEKEVTVAMIAKMLGKDKSTATRWVNEKIEAGLWEKVEVTNEIGRPVNAYRKIK
jgi:predicted transcriptional regulator